MSIRHEAEENLRVIRSLMEKATIYRAISAPAALVGGVLALGVAGTAWGLSGRLGGNDADRIPPFIESWLAVLAVASVVNFLLLRRQAVRRNEPFISPGMRLALRAMVPALVAGGFLAPFARDGGEELVASLWVLLYGLSLLAAAHFAPKSICWLGRAFFCAGALLLALGWFPDWYVNFWVAPPRSRGPQHHGGDVRPVSPGVCPVRMAPESGCWRRG